MQAAKDGVNQEGGEEKDSAYLPYVVEAESMEWSSGLHVWVKEKMQADVLAGLAFSIHGSSFVLSANFMSKCIMCIISFGPSTPLYR